MQLGAMTTLICKVKKTRLGGAVSWLARPVKHYRLMERLLESKLPCAPTRREILWCFWDYFGFRLKYRGNLEVDYFGAQMYLKSDFVRRESMANAVRFAWRDRVQDPSCWKVFLDKRAFYAAFSEYLHRHWMVADETTSWDAFCRFAETCSNRVFVKDPLGLGGRGVSLWRLDSEQARRELFDLCRSTPLMLEEVLTQCEEIQSFSGGAVNTLRIITIIDDRGCVHVARCELRMGRKGMDVDNYCCGGLAAQVDVDSGVVFSMARDENGKIHIFHPDSGKQIVGFSIPDWEQYKAFACELAMKYPGMRYVGWDIMKDSSGNLCVVEGNKDAGVGGLESGLLYGLKPYFDALLAGDTSFPHHQ